MALIHLLLSLPNPSQPLLSPVHSCLKFILTIAPHCHSWLPGSGCPLGSPHIHLCPQKPISSVRGPSRGCLPPFHNWIRARPSILSHTALPVILCVAFVWVGVFLLSSPRVCKVPHSKGCGWFPASLVSGTGLRTDQLRERLNEPSDLSSQTHRAGHGVQPQL